MASYSFLMSLMLDNNYLLTNSKMGDSLSIIPSFFVLLYHFPHVSAIITPYLFLLSSIFAAELYNKYNL